MTNLKGIVLADCGYCDIERPSQLGREFKKGEPIECPFDVSLKLFDQMVENNDLEADDSAEELDEIVKTDFFQDLKSKASKLKKDPKKDDKDKK